MQADSWHGQASVSAGELQCENIISSQLDHIAAPVRRRKSEPYRRCALVRTLGLAPSRSSKSDLNRVG